MDQSSNAASLSVHEYYCKYMQEDENMKVRLQALLNEINEKRVAIKEMHIEIGVNFCEHIISYMNRLEEISNDYDAFTKDMISRREKIIQLCHDATNPTQTNQND